MNAEPDSDLNRFAIPNNKSVLSSTTGNVATVRKLVSEVAVKITQYFAQKTYSTWNYSKLDPGQ